MKRRVGAVFETTGHDGVTEDTDESVAPIFIPQNEPKTLAPKPPPSWHASGWSVAGCCSVFGGL
jgi:hypothetical protein